MMIVHAHIFFICNIMYINRRLNLKRVWDATTCVVEDIAEVYVICEVRKKNVLDTLREMCLIQGQLDMMMSSSRSKRRQEILYTQSFVF